MDISIKLNRKHLSFFASFITCLFAHGFMFNNCFYINSMDANYVLYGSEIQEIAGRWIGCIIEEIMTRLGFYTVIKPANILISLVLISLISLLIVEIVNVNNKIAVVLISSLMTISPSIIQLLGFNFVCHIDFFAELLMVYALYLCYVKNRIIIPIILATVSIGIYQAYIALYICLIYVIIIKYIISGNNIKDIIVKIFKPLITIIIAFVLYLIGNSVFIKIINVKNVMYGMLDGKQGGFSIIDLFSRIPISYSHILEIRNGYGGICNFKFVLIFIIILWVYVLVRLLLNKNVKIHCKIVIIVLLLLSPIIFDLNYILTNTVAIRTQVNMFFIILLPIILNDTLNKDIAIASEDIINREKVVFQVVRQYHSVIIKGSAILLLCMFVFISIGEHYNLYIINKDIERHVNFIANKIYNHPDYEDGIEIVVMGDMAATKNVGSARDTTVFKIHDIPYLEALNAEYAMEQHFKLYSSLKVEAIISPDLKSEFIDMPSYPKDGCIKKISNKHLLVKFSD